MRTSAQKRKIMNMQVSTYLINKIYRVKQKLIYPYSNRCSIHLPADKIYLLRIGTNHAVLLKKVFL
jgi:hypothetical protein